MIPNVFEFLKFVKGTKNYCRFLDVVANWPGATHDAAVFENCSLKVGKLFKILIDALHLLNDLH